MEFKIATRKQTYLKLNISGPSGSGKTMSALLMAKGLVGSWDKVGLIDTENGSASLYSHIGGFQCLDLTPPFSPDRYSQALDAAINAGFKVVIIDSSTHEWNWCIEFNEKLAQSKYKGNTWSAWNETTPKHDSFVNKVLQSRIHVITCTRSKTETVMGDDRKVKKIGMKDIQREGWEYELTVSLSIDRDTHMAIASKDRTNLFEGEDPFIITEQTGTLIKQWCEQGVVEVKQTWEQAELILTDVSSVEELTVKYKALSDELKKDQRVINLCAEIKLHFTKPIENA